jgi:hypothetical protein
MNNANKHIMNGMDIKQEDDKTWTVMGRWFTETPAIYLKNESIILKKLMKYVHDRDKHPTINMMLNKIIQIAWSGDRRRLARTTIRECEICARYNNKPNFSKMLTLPNFRKETLLPFTFVSIDFAGPISYKEGKTKKAIKLGTAYIFIVMCLVTRAVHLEICPSLTSRGVELMLKTFLARRGQPKVIYSDRGSSLIKLKNQIETQSKSDVVDKWIATEIITWNLIPVNSHHFNESAQVAGKLFKRHFLRAYGDALLHYSEVHQAVIKIKGLINRVHFIVQLTEKK